MKTCPQCHAEMDDNAAFCTKCGAKIEQGMPQQENTQEQSAQEQSAQQQSAQQQSAQQQNTTQSAGNTAYAQQEAFYGNPSGAQYYQQPMVDIYDHTSEFDAQDVSDNKVFAMVVYLLGTIGIIIALLASRSSKYTAFHVRQALKFTVVNFLLGVIGAILCFTFIVPVIVGVMMIVLFVIRIICFFQICNGKAKEPYIIRNLGFLK